jgi:5-formyltetrahydrofolate cyclo-ligase
MNALVHGKDELRHTYRRLRDTVPLDEAAAAADAAAAHLLAMPVIARARTVAVYAPVHGELSPAPAVRALRERGVAIAYPRVLSGEQTLAFHVVAGDHELTAGTFGIREPSPDAPRVGPGAPAPIDVYLVPGLAFDDRGTRLGWGRGYYDRTLASDPHAVRVGYCYQCQVVPDVPRTADDLPVHHIVTEVGTSAAGVAS